MSSPALALIGVGGEIEQSTESFRRRYEDRAELYRQSPEIESILLGESDRAVVSLEGVSAEVEAVTDAAGLRHALLTMPTAEAVPAASDGNALLAESFGDSPAVVWLKDLEGRYLRVNERYTALLGTPPDRLVGKTDAELEAAATVDGPRLQARDGSGPEPLQLEYTVPPFEGRPPLAALRFAVRNRDGDPIAVCGVASSLDDAAVARAEASRLIDIERWSALDAGAVRQELLTEWGVVADGRVTAAPAAAAVAQGLPSVAAPMAAQATSATPSTAAAPAPPPVLAPEREHELLGALERERTRATELERALAQAQERLTEAPAGGATDPRTGAELERAREEASAARAEAEQALADAEAARAEADAARREAAEALLHAERLEGSAEEWREQAEHAEVDGHGLRARLEQAEAEVKRSRVLLEQAETDAAGLRTRIEQAGTESQESRSRMHQAETEAHKLRAQIEQVEANAQQSRARIEQAESDAVGVRTRLQQAEADAAGLRTRLEHAEADALQSRTRLQESEAEAQQSRSQLLEAQTATQSARARLEQAQAEARTLTARLEEANREASALRTRSEQAEKAAEQSSKRAEDAEIDARAVRAGLEEAEAATRGLRTRLEDAEADARGLRTRLEEAEADHRSLRARLEQAEETSQQAQARVEEAEAGAREARRRAEQAAADAKGNGGADPGRSEAEAELRATLARRETERSEAESALKSAVAERSELEAALKAAVAERAEAESAVKTAAAERAAAEAALTAATAQRAAAEAALTAATAERTKAEAARITALAERDAAVAKAAELQRELDEQRLTLTRLADASAGAAARAVKLTAAVESERARTDELVQALSAPPVTVPTAAPSGAARVDGPDWSGTAQRALVASLATAADWRSGVEQAVRVLGSEGRWDMVRAWAPDEPGALRCTALWKAAGGLTGADRLAHEAPRTGAGSLLAQAIHAPTVTWLADLDATGDEALGAAASEGMSSAVLLPIRDGATTIGLLELFSRTRLEPEPRLAMSLEAAAVQLGRHANQVRLRS